MPPTPSLLPLTPHPAARAGNTLVPSESFTAVTDVSIVRGTRCPTEPGWARLSPQLNLGVEGAARLSACVQTATLPAGSTGTRFITDLTVVVGRGTSFAALRCAEGYRKVSGRARPPVCLPPPLRTHTQCTPLLPWDAPPKHPAHCAGTSRQVGQDINRRTRLGSTHTSIAACVAEATDLSRARPLAGLSVARGASTPCAPPGYERIEVDLNEGTGGEPIFFCKLPPAY